MKFHILLITLFAFCANGFTQQDYKAGDFNHQSAYSTGSWSSAHILQNNTSNGLSWWLTSESGGWSLGNGRISGKDMDTTVFWDTDTALILKGDTAYKNNHRIMWAWQMIQDSAFAQTLYAQVANREKIIAQGVTMNSPELNKIAVCILSNQFDSIPSCKPLAQFEYIFDAEDKDSTGGALFGWEKSSQVGKARITEAIKWLQENHGEESYFIPTSIDDNDEITIADIRNWNTAGPNVFFGFEGIPGAQKAVVRGKVHTDTNRVTTFGGCSESAAIVGGMWDALLSEGRQYWIFTNSNFRDTTTDFYPGEYQKTYANIEENDAHGLLNGLQSGNSWVVTGDLIDSLDFHIETINRNDAMYAKMGTVTTIPEGKSLKISILVRDPQGSNLNTYDNYTNPELNHIDLIMGKVGERLDTLDGRYNLPATSTTSVIARFDAQGGITDANNLTSIAWEDKGNGFFKIVYEFPNITDSCYFRLRGTNLVLNTANETDEAGNPLPDSLMGENNASKAFADLWFYSNPIFIYPTREINEIYAIKVGNDDAEEALVPLPEQIQTRTVGTVYHYRTSLKLGCETGDSLNPQITGLRFSTISIPQNSLIEEAYIEFLLGDNSSSSDSCKLHIKTGDVANASPFTTSSQFELSRRTKLPDSIEWNIPPGALLTGNTTCRTPNLSSLIEQIIRKYSWQQGNALSFFISGKGSREVKSFNGSAAGAPKLVIRRQLSNEEIKQMQIRDSIECDLQIRHDSATAFFANISEENYTIPSYSPFLASYLTMQASPSLATIDAFYESFENLRPAELPYNICMNFYENATNKMAFSWLTNLGINGGRVEIVEGEANSDSFSNPLLSVLATNEPIYDLNYNVYANDVGIPTNSKRSYTSNKVVATGLQPNTLYSFRVGKENAWSEIGSFTTADTAKRPFTFIYFTDPQADTPEMFQVAQSTTHKAYQFFPDTKFYLSSGDLVETRGNYNSEWEYEQFFSTQQDIWLNQPLVSVAGNHDKSTNKNYSMHFNTANPSFDQQMATTPGSVYSFVYNGILFLALNHEDYSVTGYLDSLAVWMNREVKKHPNVSWKIAFFHRPLYTGASHHGDSDGRILRDKLGPVFDSLKIDVTLQGHDHVYEVIGPVYNKQLVPKSVNEQETVAINPPENVTGLTGGNFNLKKGTLYFMNNSAGLKKYYPRTPEQITAQGSTLGVDNYFSLFTGKFGQTGEPTFSYITVNSDSIGISTYTVGTNGTISLYDEFIITKTWTAPTLTLEPSSTWIKANDTLSVVAQANDTDGFVEQVHFFANGVYIGKDTIAPYTQEYIPTQEGIQIITAIASDDDEMQSDTAIVSIEVTPAEDYYELEHLSLSCTDTLFCIPIRATKNIDSCLALEIQVNYEATQILPTGNTFIADFLSNSNFMIHNQIIENENNSTTLYISRNNPATDSSTLHGTGELLCIEFRRNNLFAGESASISALIIENRNSSNKRKTANTALIETPNNYHFTGNIVNWNNQSPMQNINTTTILALPMNEDTSSNFTAIANTQGEFQLNAQFADSISINRDIPDSVSVHATINAMDAYLTARTIEQGASYTPSIHQILAMDVNQDGHIDYTDAQLINERGIGSIVQFPKFDSLENYRNSKDWLFMETSLLNKPEFIISTNYPESDSVGYSLHTVPKIPEQYGIPKIELAFNCIEYTPATYYGILLGNAYLEKTEPIIDSYTQFIKCDLEHVNYIQNWATTPIAIISDSAVHALDIDLAVSENIEDVIDIEHKEEVVCNWHFNKDKHLLSIGAYSLNKIDSISIAFDIGTNNKKLSKTDFTAELALLNGEPSQFRIDNITTSEKTRTPQEIKVHPNPAQNELLLTCEENALADIIDITGKVVISKTMISAKSINRIKIISLPAGPYTLKIYNANFCTNHKFVIE